MNNTLFKLGALILTAWSTLGNSSLDYRSFGIVAVLLGLAALLEAGNTVCAEAHSGSSGQSSFMMRLFSISGAPFYLALMAFTFVVTDVSGTRSRIMPPSSEASMCGAEGGGCGSKGGCGSGGCGSSSGGSCGCSSKSKAKTPAHTATTAQRPISQEELRQRAAEVQKRALSANTGSAGGLPGLGTNPRPLPPGLVPKAGAVLPPGTVVPSTPPERTAPSAQSTTPSVTTPPAATPAPANGTPANLNPKDEAPPPSTDSKPASEPQKAP